MRALPIPAIGDRSVFLALSLSRATIAVAAISLVALALRLTWVLYVDTFPLGGDPSWYFSVAMNLAEGRGFIADHEIFSDNPIPGEPTAFWPPAYPFVLAGVWKVFGISITSAKVLNAVLGALAVPFVYDLGRRLFNERAGFLAAGVYAVLPNAIAWLPLLFPESMFTLLLVVELWLLVAFRPRPGVRWFWPALAAGAVAGLAALTRGQGMVLVPLAALYWLSRDGWRPALRQSALLLVAMVAFIAPWTVRNWAVLGTPIFISSNGGVTLRIGHAPDSTGTTMWPGDPVDGVESWESPRRTEWEVRSYRVYTRRAIDYALTHPMRELELSKNKVYYLYRSDSGVLPWLTALGSIPLEPEGLEDVLFEVFNYAYYILLAGALLTMPFWLRRQPERLLLVNAVVLWTLFHIVFQGEPRYHVPLFPIFALMLAGGVFAAYERLAGRSRTASHSTEEKTRSPRA